MAVFHTYIAKDLKIIILLITNKIIIYQYELYHLHRVPEDVLEINTAYMQE